MSASTALPTHDHAARRDALRTRLEHLAVDALWVTHLPDLRWLTGLAASAGSLLLTRDGDLLVTDGRYAIAAEAAAPDLERIITRSRDWLTERVRRGWALGIDGAHLPWAQVRDLRAALNGSGLRDTAGVVAEARLRKDAAELARIRRACAITDEVMTDVASWIAPGHTEAEVARRITAEMVDRGADGAAFDPVVAAGLGGAEPHHRAGATALADGDVITIDAGAAVDGYAADCTRCVVLGTPDPALDDLLAAVEAAQRAGVAAVAAGATGGQVDAACRDLLTEAGLGEAFRHPTGHGIGLEVHEAPRLAADSTEVLTEAMVVTVEPGAYVQGLGGGRLEDTVLVTAEGAERLTTSAITPART